MHSAETRGSSVGRCSSACKRVTWCFASSLCLLPSALHEVHTDKDTVVHTDIDTAVHTDIDTVDTRDKRRGGTDLIHEAQLVDQRDVVALIGTKRLRVRPSRVHTPHASACVSTREAEAGGAGLAAADARGESTATREWAEDDRVGGKRGGPA